MMNLMNLRNEKHLLFQHQIPCCMFACLRENHLCVCYVPDQFHVQCQHQERKIHPETKHSNPLGVEYGYRAKEEKTESL
jgi:hypothetical protein